MSNETKQAVYDAARRFVGDATSTDELSAALKAHEADEKPKPKRATAAKPKPAAVEDDGA